MGQPAGVTVEEVQARNRAKHDVADAATFIIADDVEKALANPEATRLAYRVSVQDWPGVLQRLRKFQQRIDPYGDWR